MMVVVVGAKLMADGCDGPTRFSPPGRPACGLDHADDVHNQIFVAALGIGDVNIVFFSLMLVLLLLNENMHRSIVSQCKSGQMRLTVADPVSILRAYLHA